MPEEKFQPLSDIWASYSEALDEAVTEGYIEDEDLAERYVWPADLEFGDAEIADVKKYVHERTTEIVDRVRDDGGIDPNFLASYIFRTILCGVMWQKERRG